MSSSMVRALFTALAAPAGPALPPVVSRSPLVLFHVDSGGCEACGLEVEALKTGGYGLAEAGVEFSASPRLADMLLVTGGCSRMMAPVIRAAWEAMPRPKGLIAVGACARDGGLFPQNYATLGGLENHASVDLFVPGCPPTPSEILGAVIAVTARARSGSTRDTAA